jgi:hypothetical protein
MNPVLFQIKDRLPEKLAGINIILNNDMGICPRGEVGLRIGNYHILYGNDTKYS